MRVISSSSRYARTNSRHRSGFTILEVLLAIFVFLALTGIATFSLTQGLRSKRSLQTYVELQQNLRAAMQQITQDIRFSARLGPWNDPSSGCSHAGDACSLSDRLSLLVTTGRYTSVAETPGASYSNSTATHLCDARRLTHKLVLIDDGSTSHLVRVTRVLLQRDYSQPCQSSSPANRDLIRHSNNRISGTWRGNTYAYQVEKVTYRLIPDPLDASRTVLYRGGPAGTASGIVAFDVDSIKFSYGVPLNPGAASNSVQKLRFYDSLSAAASALGSSYSDDPASTQNYVGRVVRAIRVTINGSTPEPLKTSGNRGQYQITETVDLR